MVKLLSAHGAALISLNVALIAGFIAVFFFTYGTHVEQLVLKRQIQLVLDDFVGTLKLLAPTAVWDQLGSSAASIPPADTSHDQAVIDANAALRKKAFTLIAVMLGIALVIVFVAWHFSGRSFSLQRLLMESLVLLGFVAIVEFLFYNLVASNYRSVDPSALKRVMVQNLDDYAGDVSVTDIATGVADALSTSASSAASAVGGAASSAVSDVAGKLPF